MSRSASPHSASGGRDIRAAFAVSTRTTGSTRTRANGCSADGSTETVSVTVRIDTPIEVDYYEHGGILPFVLRQLVSSEVTA